MTATDGLGVAERSIRTRDDCIRAGKRTRNEALRQTTSAPWQANLEAQSRHYEGRLVLIRDKVEASKGQRLEVEGRQ